MTLVRLFPSFEVFQGLTSDEKSWLIAKEYGICNGWRVNFAIDESGNSFGDTGISSDVSSDLDRLLLGKLRSLSDVIVTSGQTARAEKYRSSKHAPIAIFTETGNLDSVPAIQGMQYFTPLVLTPEPNQSMVESHLSDVDVLVLPFDVPDDASNWPVAISEVLHGEGYQSPILESGRSTLGQFLAISLIDEVCLSITHSKPTGVSARDLSKINLNEAVGPFEGFSLRRLFTDGKSTFSLWRRGSSSS